MKNTIKYTFSTAALLILSISGFSQKALTKADAAFAQHQYFTAITYYKQAYADAPADKKPTVLYRSGFASQEINDYKAAEAYYQKAIAANFDDPIVYFKLAEVLKSQKRYDDAIVEYNNYKSKGGNSKKADLGAKSCELSQQWEDNPLRYKIENMSAINSKERDYSPSYSDKKYQTIVFTSNRPGGMGGQDITTGNAHSDIYETKVDKNGKWSTPVLLPPGVCTEVNEGQGWVSKKGDMIFFTRCPEVKDKPNKCGIYMCRKQGSTWGPASALPFNNDTVHFAHPSLSTDGKVLYFVSRMSGGYGGIDVWSCSFDAKTNNWGQPKNLGPAVNTEGDEMFPTVSNDGKYLYFSSNYHPGMGGLDLFMAEAGADGKFTKPVENLKAPINSSYDDFGIIYEGKKNRGYFTSNREGGKGGDDLWSFYLPPLNFNVKGVVFSEGDPTTGKGKGEPVEVVKMKLIGSDGTITEAITPKNGTYSLKLKEKTTYTLTTEAGKGSRSANFMKDGYLNNKDQRIITTVGLDKSQDFVADFFVKPVIPQLRLPEIQYATGSFALKPESKDSLIYLYNILKDNPTIICELNAHTDSRGDAKANMKLSQDRAQSCVDFLVNEKGIASSRLVAKGFGSTQPLVTDAMIKTANSNEEKEAMHQKNRRTTFKVLSFDYVDPNAPKNPPKPVKPKSEDEEEEE